MEDEKSSWEAEENIEEAMSEIVLLCGKLNAANPANYLEKTFRILNLIENIRANIVFLNQYKANRYQAQLEHLSADFVVPADCPKYIRENIAATQQSIREHIGELPEAAEIYQEIFGTPPDDSEHDTARVGDTVVFTFEK